MANKTNIWNINHNEIKECVICGGRFKVKWSALKRRKCCSRKCKDKLQSQLIKGKNNPRYGEGKRRKCKTCKKEYRTSPSIKLKYCSNECYSRKGKNNANWKGGITPKNKLIRHSKEYVEWRTKRMQLDNYTCQLCKKHGGNLEVHHIKPFAQYKALRFSINNGMTLCVPCHKKIDKYR